MLQPEDFVDILSAVAVIIIISVFITLAWMSTYVRDQPLVATAVVVFQQESSPGPSAVSTPTASTSGCGSLSESLSTQNSQSESQSMTATLQEPEVYQGPLNAGDDAFSKETKLNENETLGDSQQNGTTNDGKEISKIKSTSKEVSSTETISGPVQEDKEANCSSLLEPKPIPEEGFCDPSGSAHRHRNKANPVKEDTPKEFVTSSDLANRTFEAEAEVQYEHLSEESIRIKLKFLDDTQRLVRGQLTDEVGSFKRANFNPELASNRVVRLIFNGQLLNRDNSTLGQYGLFDNCVVHCHISQPQPTNSNEMNANSLNQENDGLDLSEILSPLLLVVVAFLWYLRYEYSHIFNTSATVILVCLTAILLISQYAFTISFNVSWTYERGNNSGNGGSNSQSSRSRVETRRDEETRIQQDATLPSLSPSTRDPAGEETSATATSGEINGVGRTNSKEDSSSKQLVSSPSEAPPTGEASFAVTDPFITAETVLLSS